MTSARGHGAIVYCLNSGSDDSLTGRHNVLKINSCNSELCKVTTPTSFPYAAGCQSGIRRAHNWWIMKRLFIQRAKTKEGKRGADEVKNGRDPPLLRENTLEVVRASHLSSPSTNLTRGFVARRLFKVLPCREGTIHLRTSLFFPGLERRLNGTDTGWATLMHNDHI
ncbi:hypothetical protein TNCV_325611 [Trichonephila clavipes]|nr:hypothetical protein TNCV_325611 [Trichonephila clavipes]